MQLYHVCHGESDEYASVLREQYSVSKYALRGMEACL